MDGDVAEKRRVRAKRGGRADRAADEQVLLHAIHRIREHGVGGLQPLEHGGGGRTGAVGMPAQGQPAPGATDLGRAGIDGHAEQGVRVGGEVVGHAPSMIARATAIG